MKNTCKTCKHFKNAQRELNYWDSTGFCTNDKFKFNTVDGRLIGVFDSENPKSSNISGNCSHDFETLNNDNHSRNKEVYVLAVEENFGCIFHEKTER